MTHKKIQPGRKIRDSPVHQSRYINDTVDVINAWKDGRVGAVGRPASSRRSTNQVEIKNLTGSDRQLGDVVELGGHLLSEVTQDYPWLEGNTFAGTKRRKFAVLSQPIPDGSIDTAQSDGVCIARVNVTDTSHTHAVPVSGYYILSSGPIGPVELLLPPPATGEQLLWVRIDQSENFCYAVTLAASVDDGNTTSVTLSDGRSVSAVNRSGVTLAAGNAVVIQDLVTGEYMIVGGGVSEGTPGTDLGAIVKVTSPTASPSTCLWSGQIVTVSGTPSGACTNPFVTAANCYLLVLNSDGGSWDSSEDKVTLTVGDHYIGRFVFSVGGLPVYAIRHTGNSGTELFYAELTTTLLQTDSTASITTVISFIDDQDPGITTAANVYGLAAANGSSVLCARYATPDPDQLILIQVHHNERTVLESIKLDSPGAPTKVVQVERKISAMDDGAGTTDADAIILAAETVDVDVKVDSPSAPTKLQQTKKTIRTFPGSSVPADSDIVGIEECGT